MNKDIHQDLGPKGRRPTMEDCIAWVRQVYPRAVCEGPTGPERTFWVDRELVAHAWKVQRSDGFWLRVKL